MSVLLFDIGGTKTRLAISQDKESISEPLLLETDKNYQKGVDLLIKSASNLVKFEELEIAAGGIAGPLDRDKSCLVGSPNLPDWIAKPLKKDLEKILGKRVLLENDAALAGLGEATYGAGKGFSIVSYLTVSTGVGGVRVVDGKIDKNFYGFEPGHQIIDSFKTLESLISGTAILKKYGKSPEDIDDPNIWDEITKYLAIGLNNIVVLWSSEIIVLGGGVMNKISIERLSSYLKGVLSIFPETPQIKKTLLEQKAGLYGGLALIES